MDPLSLVASTIAIVQATSSTYKSIQHIRGLPKEFNEVSRSLPLAEDSLLLLRQRLEDEAGDESVNKTIKPFVDECEAKAKKLQNIFEKLEIETRNKDGSVRKTYRNVLVSLGKGYRVETLMQSLLKDLCALATNHSFRGGLQREVIQIKEAIEELSKVESSVPDSEINGSGTHLNQSIASNGTGYMSHYSGEGQYVNAGNGQQFHYSGQNQHINAGGGKQFNAQSMNFEVQTREDHQRRRSAILESLYTVPYLDRKNRNPDRSPGTCEWFVNHSQFKQWRASRSSSLLWVSANPGCGKSVLAKYLVDELKTSESGTTCYFFFKDDFEDQKTAIGALRCILHQLFKQREVLFSDRILKQLEACRAQIGNSFDDLWDALLMAAREINAGEIICLFDAFDECEEQERQKLAKTLRKFYDTGNNAKDGINLKVLITCRPYDKIGRGFQPLDIPGLPIIHLKGESDEEMLKIAKEIDFFIEDRVSCIRKSHSLRPDEEHLLLQELRSIPNQTYLWVYLTLEWLERQIVDIDRTRIREIASSLPKDINEAYEKILNKSNDFAKSKKLLHIIVAASRPLTVTEVGFALALRPEHTSYVDWDRKSEERCGRYIRDLCGLFINIKESRVYLLHQTAKEFLVRKDDPQPREYQDSQFKWKASLSPAESHRILCEICIWHLLFSEFETHPLSWELVGNVSEYLQDRVFLEYSATNWAIHFRESNIAHKTAIQQLQQICAVSSKRCQTWFGVYWVRTYGRFPKGFTSLMLASYFGLKPLVQKLIAKKDVKPLAKDGYEERSALHWASENGFDEVVKLLAKHFTNIITKVFQNAAGIDAQDKYGRTPLSYAAWNGHITTARLLIRAGARVDKQDNIGVTPITYALCTGHEAMASEMTKGTDVGSVYKIRQKIFWSAVESGNEIMVKRLLESGVSISPIYTTGDLLLGIAVRLEIEALVKLLLTNGANANTRDKTGDLPLFRAVELKNEALVKLLLDSGADVNRNDSIGRLPLIKAVQLKSEALVKLLLTNGANANMRAKTKTGDLPLIKAVELKSEPIVKLLLANGANVNMKDEAGNLPLIKAVQPGNKALIKLLLDNSADVNMKDEAGRLPLTTAVRLGNEAIVKLLLNNGADPGQDCLGMESLLIAIQAGNRALVKLLLDADAALNEGNSYDGMALTYAIKKRDKTIVKLLLDWGADPNLKNHMHHTPLSLAIDTADMAIVKLLLDRGADPNESGDSSYCSDKRPLIMAMWKGDTALVKLLLDKGANPNVRSKDGRRAVALANAQGNEIIANLLIDKAAIGP